MFRVWLSIFSLGFENIENRQHSVKQDQPGQPATVVVTSYAVIVNPNDKYLNVDISEMTVNKDPTVYHEWFKKKSSLAYSETFFGHLQKFSPCVRWSR